MTEIHVGDQVQTTVGYDPDLREFYHGADTADVLAINGDTAVVNWGEWDDEHEEPIGVRLQEIPLKYLSIYQRGCRYE